MNPDRELHLFDVDRTSPATCTICGAIRNPNQPTATACAWEHEGRDGKRPPDCINTHRPEHAPIPF